MVRPEEAALPLQEERAYFEQHRSELVREHVGEWILVKGQNRIAIYHTWLEGYVVGAGLFPNQGFLLRQITAHDEPIILTRLFTGNGADS